MCDSIENRVLRSLRSRLLLIRCMSVWIPQVTTEGTRTRIPIINNTKSNIWTCIRHIQTHILFQSQMQTKTKARKHTYTDIRTHEYEKATKTNCFLGVNESMPKRRARELENNSSNKLAQIGANENCIIFLPIGPPHTKKKWKIAKVKQKIHFCEWKEKDVRVIRNHSRHGKNIFMRNRSKSRRAIFFFSPSHGFCRFYFGFYQINIWLRQKKPK